MLVARLTSREINNGDDSARCGRCFGRGYTSHVRENGRAGYTKRPGFTARTCGRCGGGGLVRIEREATAARAAGEGK